MYQFFFDYSFVFVNGYPFLVIFWNLFLAALPLFFFIVLQNLWQKNHFLKMRMKILAGFLFFLWLVFLPNSAYLITVVRHLLSYCPENFIINSCPQSAWQIMFFYLYALSGWVLFVFILRAMAKLISQIFSKKTAFIFVLAVIPLVAIGVLFGLTERFNSWDILFYPLAILENLLKYMKDWEYFRNFLMFAAGYYFLFFLGDYLFVKKIGE